MTPEDISAWEPFLTTIPLFAGLSGEDVARVARRMQSLSLPKGTMLYSQGDASDAFYIITSGHVRVTHAFEGVETVDAFLGRGETLGEGGLMTGEPRRNTVRLDSTCELLKLKRQDFEEVLRENPPILLHISRILARRIVRAQGPTPGAPAQLVTLSAALPAPDGVLLCVHLALQLVSQTRRRVLLADLRPDAGVLAEAIGIRPRAPAAADLAASQLRDGAWLQSLLQRHPSGLAVLSLPAASLGGRLFNGLYQFLNLLREEHDLVLVCLGGAAGDVERSIIAEADRVLLAGGPAAPESLRRMEAELLPAAEEAGKILTLWLGEAPAAPLPGAHALIPWPDDLGPRLTRTGSPYEAMDGRPRTMRAIERLARRLGGVRVGLALGSGAALGHSLIGMLKVFARENIPVDLVAGTSGGALVGAWLAAGMEPEEMQSIALRMTKAWMYENLFLDLTVPRSGVFGGETLLRFLRTFFGEKTFAELELPLACVSTDIETGERVVLRQGRVAEAVRASCGLPMIFAPFNLDGRYLVDGGLVEPVPTRAAAELGADILVAVNLTMTAGARNPRRKPQTKTGLLEASLDMDLGRLKELATPELLKAPNLFQVLVQMLHTFEYELARSRVEFAHVAIQPDLSAFSWTDTHRARELIRAGERYGEEYAPQVKALLPFFTHLGKVPRPPSSPLRP